MSLLNGIVDKIKINKKIVFVICILLMTIIYYYMTKDLFIDNNQNNINEIYQLLQYVTCIFNKTDTQYTMVGGTLLGSVRQQGLIPWDIDADIAVLNKSFIEILDILSPLKDKKIISYINQYNGIVKVKFKDSKIAIDIFIMNKMNDIYIFAPPYNYIYPNEYFTKNELYPLKNYKFGPLLLSGPNIAYNYLNRTYPNWFNTAEALKFDWGLKYNIKIKNKKADIVNSVLPDIIMPTCN